MKDYSAVEIESAGNLDLILAIVDDFSPTAIEERGDGVRAFFANTVSRDAARDALAARFRVQAIDVPDEDWARRSQENLAPVTIGRITLFPNPVANRESQIPNPDAIAIVIAPSMGFGTGHHATTRLCLAALQAIDLKHKSVLDVGTGSGVLAIAADRLGADRAVGIDSDADAIQSARENLSLNPEARHVSFEIADLSSAPRPAADVVLANLTGALLVRSARTLLAAVRDGGTLIVSGLQTDERDQVLLAFSSAGVVCEREEDGWLGLVLKADAK